MQNLNLPLPFYLMSISLLACGLACGDESSNDFVPDMTDGGVADMTSAPSTPSTRPMARFELARRTNGNGSGMYRIPIISILMMTDISSWIPSLTISRVLR